MGGQVLSDKNTVRMTSILTVHIIRLFHILLPKLLPKGQLISD